MASDKKRRKQAKQTRPAAAPGKPFVHADGDRRRRGGADAKQAIRDKKMRQTFAGGLEGGEEE